MLCYSNYRKSHRLVIESEMLTSIHLSFSCRMCSLSFHLKIEVAEDLIQSGKKLISFFKTINFHQVIESPARNANIVD